MAEQSMSLLRWSPQGMSVCFDQGCTSRVVVHVGLTCTSGHIQTLPLCKEHMSAMRKDTDAHYVLCSDGRGGQTWGLCNREVQLIASVLVKPPKV